MVQSCQCQNVAMNDTPAGMGASRETEGNFEFCWWALAYRLDASVCLLGPQHSSKTLLGEGSARSRLQVFFKRERSRIVGESNIALDTPRAILGRVCDLTRVVF